MKEAQPSNDDFVIAAQFRQGKSILTLAIEYGMSRAEIQNAIRRVMIQEGVYDVG